MRERASIGSSDLELALSVGLYIGQLGGSFLCSNPTGRPSPVELEIHHLIAPRTARYLTVGEFAAAKEVWLLCHGYGQLAADFLDAAHALAGPTRLLVAPEALSRFYLEDGRKVGASWMTREDRLAEIEDYVRYLDLVRDRVFEIVPRADVSLGLLGFSQGVATAARWAVRSNEKVDHVVFWASELPPELSFETLRDTRVTLVGGRRDHFFTAEKWREARERLDRDGVSYEELRFEGGHRLDDVSLRALAGDSQTR